MSILSGVGVQLGLELAGGQRGRHGRADGPGGRRHLGLPGLPLRFLLEHPVDPGEEAAERRARLLPLGRSQHVDDPAEHLLLQVALTVLVRSGRQARVPAQVHFPEYQPLVLETSFYKTFTKT